MKPKFIEEGNFIKVIGHYDNPVLCAKLTLLADLYAVEHREGYAVFKVEDYDKLSKIDDRLDFIVSDLTDTEWEFNNNPSVLSSFTYSINFTSNNTSYTSINCNPYLQMYQLKYNNTNIYGWDEGWRDNAYKTISITSGTDTTNPDLIAWLSQNATQVIEPEPQPTSNNIFFGTDPISKICLGNDDVVAIYIGNTKIYEGGSEPTPVITDLTNTAWKLNLNIDIDENKTYNVNIKYDGYEFETLVKSITITPRFTLYDLFFDGCQIAENTDSSILTTHEDEFIITGGTDATNSDLIQWLLNNATQVDYTPTEGGGSND